MLSFVYKDYKYVIVSFNKRTMVEDRVPLPRLIITFLLFTTKLNYAQQSENENKNFQVFLTNGFQNQQTLPTTGPVLISANNKNSLPSLDPQQLNVKQQINLKQQISPEALKNQQKLPVGVVNLVNGKLSQISASDPNFPSSSHSKGGQNNIISTSVPISMSDLSKLQPLFGNQPIVLTEVVGDKNQPSSVTLHVIPASPQLQSNVGTLNFPQYIAQSTQGNTGCNRAPPSSVQIIPNDASPGSNLQNNLLTNQQLLPTFQRISSGDPVNRMKSFNTYDSTSLSLNSLQPNFGLNYNNQAPLYGFAGQPFAPESSIMPESFNNQYTFAPPQYMPSPAYIDSYSPQRSNRKSKSSLKALLPLLLGILREKYSCCPNCKCGNCYKNNSNLSDVTDTITSRLIEAPTSKLQENNADNDREEDAENYISSEIKQLKKKIGKYKKSIDSEEDYVDSFEEED